MILESMTSLYRLDQHGAALPAADTFGGDAALGAQPLHRVDEMQHDAIAAAANGMPEADRAAVDIQFCLVDLPGGAFKPKNLAAELFVVPGGKASQHLRRERLVQFPGLDVPERQFVALQEFGRRQHRAEAHDARIERRPLAVDDDGFWLQSM